MRYHRLLKSCQIHGRRVGVVYAGGWATICYLLDGMMIYFRHGMFRIACYHSGDTLEPWTKA